MATAHLAALLFQLRGLWCGGAVLRNRRRGGATFDGTLHRSCFNGRTVWRYMVLRLAVARNVSAINSN